MLSQKMTSSLSCNQRFPVLEKLLAIIIYCEFQGFAQDFNITLSLAHFD